MMTPIAFKQWCEQLGLPSATRKLLVGIRSSPPVRRVTSRAKNVSGVYPSSKMKMTIQFESQVEQRAILVMEYDPEVLEFYDQPTTFQIHYQSGKKMVGPYYTPDFLVLRRAEASLEEWKTASELHQLAERIPARYQQTADDLWHCPPAEAFTDPLGLSFHVRSSAELHPTYVGNLAFLEDYDGVPLIIPESVQTHILQRLREMPGLPLSALSYDGSGIRPHDIYAMLAQKLIYTDLYVAPLIKHGGLRLYLSEDQARAYTHLHSTALVSRVGSPMPNLASDLPTNTLLVWDGRSFTLVNPGKTTTTLLPEKGPPLQVPTTFFFHLLEQGEIKRLGSESETPTTAPEVDQLLDRATPTDQRQANERFAMVSAYLQGEKDKCAAVAPRTLHRWVARYREAEAQWGCGYVGLLTRRSQQGNHTPKAPQASRHLMDTFIIGCFETSRHESAAAVYRAYEQECHTQNLHPLSARAFYQRIEQRSGPHQTEQREGARAAYQETPWFWEIEQSTPRHGSRPFEIAHIDHTELDIEVRSSSTGQLLGRPWATFLMDAYSRRFLAVYLTFDPPSYRSVMMALRICVQRFERLPQYLVVDGGREFHSDYLERLLAQHRCTKKTRPWAKPHFGSVIERLFDTTNRQFLYSLLGNTQAAKRARLLTRAVDPKHHALWMLADLYSYLLEYAYDVYDQNDHSSLGMSPRATYLCGMRAGGEREQRRIAYDERFLKDTCPTTSKETAIIQKGGGVKIHYFWYWNNAFRNPEVIKTAVPVRYDPFNLGVAYAQVQGQWVTCRASHPVLEGHTERELFIATQELRKQARRNGERAALTSARLAAFIEKAVSHEAVLAQRLCDLEEKQVLSLIAEQSGFPQTLHPGSPPLPTNVQKPQARKSPLTALSTPVDVERLPRLGDYH